MSGLWIVGLFVAIPMFTVAVALTLTAEKCFGILKSWWPALICWLLFGTEVAVLCRYVGII